MHLQSFLDHSLRPVTCQNYSLNVNSPRPFQGYGKGAWFARRSIHEGVGFARFKRSMQIEFEKSLAEQGPPGSGNVRGIGGEELAQVVASDREREVANPDTVLGAFLRGVLVVGGHGGLRIGSRCILIGGTLGRLLFGLSQSLL